MKKLFVYLTIILSIIVALPISGCSHRKTSNSDLPTLNDFDSHSIPSYNPNHYPVTVTQYTETGKPISVTYTKPPQRIITLWQNSAETLLALGEGSRIMAALGIPNKKYLLPELQPAYEKIPYKNLQPLSLEAVMGMQPDFILGWYSTFSEKNWRGFSFWQNQGTTIFITPSSISIKKQSKEHTLDEEYLYIETLGKIFDRNEKAQEIVNTMKQQVNSTIVYANTQAISPKVLVLEKTARNTFIVYGKNTLAGNIVTTLHGNLLLQNQTSTTLEEITALNPDVIFLVLTEENYDKVAQLKNEIAQINTLQNIPAVKNNRLITLPLYTVYSPGIRSLDGIQIIAKGLYPNLTLPPSKPLL